MHCWLLSGCIGIIVNAFGIILLEAKMFERIKDRVLLLIVAVAAVLLSFIYFRFTGNYSTVPLWALVALSVYDAGKKLNKALARKLIALPFIGFFSTASVSFFDTQLNEMEGGGLLWLGVLCLAGFYFYLKKNKA